MRPTFPKERDEIQSLVTLLFVPYIYQAALVNLPRQFHHSPQKILTESYLIQHEINQINFLNDLLIILYWCQNQIKQLHQSPQEFVKDSEVFKTVGKVRGFVIKQQIRTPTPIQSFIDIKKEMIHKINSLFHSLFLSFWLEEVNQLCDQKNKSHSFEDQHKFDQLGGLIPYQEPLSFQELSMVFFASVILFQNDKLKPENMLSSEKEIIANVNDHYLWELKNQKEDTKAATLAQHEWDKRFGLTA